MTKDNPFTDDAGRINNFGCWSIIIAVIVAWVIFSFATHDPTYVPRDKYGRPLTDDPYYDAPVGRTRGGDTW